MSKTISSQKRRRHSTEPSPGKSQSFSVKPSSKKLITDNEFKTVTMPKQGQPPVSYPSTQSNQSIFTDNNVNRLAQAVKAIMFEDLRNELKIRLIDVLQQLSCFSFSEIEKSTNKVVKLSLKVDDLEQHSRNSGIRIIRVPYTQSEESELKDFINGKSGPRCSDIGNNVADMPIARSPGTPHFLPNNMMFPPQLMQYQSGAQAMYQQMYGIMS
ncbi:unnamed protein product [Mytilus edulis]|uniref:Uncharacterized protein n=1 Tax=Mytilus edulis TaxID=6550 RepID=A0A8S3T6Z7_MYTED|nr:unnamed protein product [Mytilus edulis]